jgi:hypothetical protein
MARWVFAISSILGLVGCTATYNAGSEGSPNGKYRVYVHTRGAYGHAFIDETAKTAFVAIVAAATEPPIIREEPRDGTVVWTIVKAPKERQLFQNTYHIRGSDVRWDAVWGKDDSLTLAFYDYGTGVSFYDARKNGTPKRQIRTVTYAFDSNTRTFSERPAK